MSNLIKKEENIHYEVADYEADILCEDTDDESCRTADDLVTLPLSGDNYRSPFQNNSYRREQQKNQEEEETPEERLARLEREAYEKGFEQGQKDGLALEKRQMEEKGKQLETLFTEIGQLKARLFVEAEKEVLRLSTAVAKKIIREEIKTNGEIIGQTIRHALQFAGDKSVLKLSINPDDMAEVRNILPDLASLTKSGKFQVIEDKGIGKGGCRLETGFGSINATIDDQLSELEKEIDREYVSPQEEAG